MADQPATAATVYEGHRLVCSVGGVRWRPTWRHPFHRQWESECQCSLNAGKLVHDV